MINRLYSLTLALAVAFASVSCSEIQQLVPADRTFDKMVVDHSVVSDDCRQITLHLVQEEVNSFKTLPDLDEIVLTESYKGYKALSDRMQPKVSGVTRPISDELRKMGAANLVLVDLTLPQELVDKQKTAILGLHSLFSEDNLFVMFMGDREVSQPMLVTEYVFNNYFVSKEGATKYLNRSILKAYGYLESRNPLFEGLDSFMITVMSDGRLYSDGRPVDSDHFEIQKMLLAKAGKYGDKHELYFKCVDDGAANDAEDFMRTICGITGGAYLKDNAWMPNIREYLKAQGKEYCDYKIVLDNPDGKLYGGCYSLLIEGYDNGEKVIESTVEYAIGTPYSPTITGGDDLATIYAWGFITLVFGFILVYLIGQVVAPYISYQRFRRKNVLSYTRNLVGPGGIVVGDICYLCKAPFKEGDAIVAKCPHTMHEECWEENGQHCPEHGRKCPEGAHYYNKERIFTDFGNASVYVKWLLAALVAGYVGWIFFMLSGGSDAGIISNTTVSNLLGKMGPVSDNAAVGMEVRLERMPVRIMRLSFIVTAMLSALALHNRLWYEKAVQVALRASISAFLCALAFFLEPALCLIFRIPVGVYFMDWIPWILSSVIIPYSATYRTGAKIQFIPLVVTGLVCWATIALWMLGFMASGYDYRVHLLFSFQIMAVGIALTIASASPRSESYFLQVSGAVKEMDIALYKWFKTSPDRIVRIGKSVDCDLNLSWDIQSLVPAMAAEIHLKGHTPYVRALEDCVFFGKRPLKIGKSYRLFHGRRFSIGKTEFMYVEKDY